MCRIFQKSATVKKPQQTSSSQQSPDSPYCDTNTMVNEYGHFDHLPNLTNTTPTSSNLMNNTISSLQNYTNENINLNMSMNSLLPSSLSWPSALLSSNLSMNSLLLKALQFKNYQPRDLTTTTNLDYTSFMPTSTTPYGVDFTSNLAASSSTSKGLDNSVQQQQQEQQQEHQEQPFNLDSIW